MSTRSWITLWSLHVLLIAAGVTAATIHWQRKPWRPALPPLRDVPLSVEPQYNYPIVVTDEQLRSVLSKLIPRDFGKQTRINHVDHALRFWGVEAEFNHPEFAEAKFSETEPDVLSGPGVLSGREMLALLTDHRRFTQRYGAEATPLLIDDGSGIRVEVNQGITTSSHVDHTMAGLAEVGTPLDFVIQTPERQTTYRSIVEQALRDFSLNQIEYEWSAVTFALLVKSDTHWVTHEGQRMTFDRIARRMMRQEMPQGVCFGNHRLHALVMLLRVDSETPILSPQRRRDIMDYLHGMTRRLVQTQHPSGFWNVDWPVRRPDHGRPSRKEGDRLGDRIIATGHALEWWALAPRELHPPRHVLASAGQWLARTVEELSAEQIQDYYTYLTHAGRSLSLWRGVRPAEVSLGGANDTLQLSAKAQGGGKEPRTDREG